MRGRCALLCLTALAALTLLAASRPVHAQTPSPEALAQQLQKRYGTIKDFRADFTHQVQGSVLRTLRTTERGEIKVKKPGRVWMTYAAPQKKDFVADSTHVYTYVAADRSGTKGPMPTGDDISLAILFVAGRGDLVKDFRATMPAAQPADAWHLTLTPVKRQEDFAAMTLVVDRRTLVLRGLTTVDHKGGTFVFAFTNIRENVGLKDSDFHFIFPRNANVIYTGSSGK
ncbi:MAG: outer membrane lipoprotein carrier protein LolA [Vicinamibacterales bacterium]